MNNSLSWFTRTATFIIALGSIVMWAARRPYFNFSDTWQIVIDLARQVRAEVKPGEDDSVLIEFKEENGKSKTVKVKSGGRK